jgi:hypothetical protein
MLVHELTSIGLRGLVVGNIKLDEVNDPGVRGFLLLLIQLFDHFLHFATVAVLELRPKVSDMR